MNSYYQYFCGSFVSLCFVSVFLSYLSFVCSEFCFMGSTVFLASLKRTFFVCLFVYLLCLWCSACVPAVQEMVVMAIRGSCDPPYACWKLNLGPLE